MKKAKPPLKFRYTCVDAPHKELEYIDDHEITITFKTFRRYISKAWLDRWMDATGYGPWLRLWNDWHVSYGRSTLPDGRPVYIMYWSEIHHVFY